MKEVVFQPAWLLETVATSVKVVPSEDTWILYDDAYAASQFKETLFTCCTEPRSTCHHWPSANDQDHRVDEFPSFALSGVREESYDEDAVAGLPRALSGNTGALTAEYARAEAPAAFDAVTPTRTVCPKICRPK